MRIYILGLTIFACSLISFLPGIAEAARPTQTPSTPSSLGVDVSWPQCGKTLPKDFAFGIVGVNGGLATTTNPCLKDQLIWAKTANGSTAQEKVQLYVNTANPGGLGTDSWPRNNIDPSGATINNPYGECVGADNLACAWQYGWNRAQQDVIERFMPAAAQANLPTEPSSYIWWLDVETENTWKLGGTEFDHQSNVADIEGMTSYLASRGARVGLYSTTAQWGQIAGNAVSATSNLNGLPSWRPGGASQKTAQDACKAPGLTSGGRTILTQFVSKSLDYNVSCI